MRRRLVLIGVLAIALAACGDSSASPSPSSPDQGSVAPSSDAGASGLPESAPPTEMPTESEAFPGSTAVAICGGISVRKQPSTSGARLGTIASGVEVRVVETVDGTPYTAGACGLSGSTWLKVDRVAGKSAKAAYGAQYVYVAAGFFQ